MARLSGAPVLVEVLKGQGVALLFTLTGSQIISVYDACLDARIRIIDARHEQACGFMADAWARLTRRPAVCLLSAGPAFSNALTSMANAYWAASPVVFISGSAPLKGRGLPAFQELDQLSLARPVTKAAWQVTHPDRIAEMAGMAFRASRSGRPGPVYLDIPQDVLEGETRRGKETVRPRPPDARPGAATRAECAAALQLLEKAARPLLVVGSGAWWSEAEEEVEKFASTIGGPVFTAALGRGVVPDTHPLWCGHAIPYLSRSFRAALKRADLLIVAGHRLPPWRGQGRRLKAVQMDIEPAEIGKSFRVAAGLVGDLRATLGLLMEMMGQWRTKVGRSWLEGLKQMKEAEAASRDRPIHPYRLCKAINERIEKDAIVVADGGDTLSWTKLARTVSKPGTLLEAGPLRCIGVGLPFSIAAKVLKPEGQVFLVTGDGSLGFNFMEFQTAVRHRLPIIIIVSNDKGWGMIAHRQVKKYGRARLVAAHLGATPYHLMARDLGGYGELVTREEEIGPAIDGALASGLPACINVMTDPEAVSPESRYSLKAV